MGLKMKVDGKSVIVGAEILPYTITTVELHQSGFSKEAYDICLYASAQSAMCVLSARLEHLVRMLVVRISKGNSSWSPRE